MTDHEIDGLAAEYVLGSLDPDERRVVDARRRSDRALSDALEAWEKHLAPLSDWVPGVGPSPHLYNSIAARIWEQDAQPPRSVRASSARQTLRRWRAFAIGATAIAASLFVAAVWLFQHHPVTPTTLVSIMRKSPFGTTADENPDGRVPPAFLVTMDLKARSILVSPIAARPFLQHSYELWLTPQSPAAPLSLGLIEQSGITALAWKEQYAADEMVHATLAVSLEPEGGSLTGAPTGPIIFAGKLFPDAP